MQDGSVVNIDKTIEEAFGAQYPRNLVTAYDAQNNFKCLVSKEYAQFPNWNGYYLHCALLDPNKKKCFVSYEFQAALTIKNKTEQFDVQKTDHQPVIYETIFDCFNADRTQAVNFGSHFLNNTPDKFFKIENNTCTKIAEYMSQDFDCTSEEINNDTQNSFLYATHNQEGNNKILRQLIAVNTLTGKPYFIASYKNDAEITSISQLIAIFNKNYVLTSDAQGIVTQWDLSNSEAPQEVYHANEKILQLRTLNDVVALQTATAIKLFSLKKSWSCSMQ